MTRKMKPVDVELEGELQESILMTGVRLPDGSFKSIGDLVTTARDAVNQANAALLTNPLATRAALLEMKRQGMRGFPVFRVSWDGTVVLQVSYEQTEQTPPRPPKIERKKSDLQSLDALREEADSRGVDISDLGRQKFKIMERLGIEAPSSS